MKTISLIGHQVSEVRQESDKASEQDGKSTNVERIAFERGLGYLLDKIDVKTILTDAYPQILAFMKHSEAQ